MSKEIHLNTRHQLSCDEGEHEKKKVPVGGKKRNSFFWGGKDHHGVNVKNKRYGFGEETNRGINTIVSDT